MNLLIPHDLQEYKNKGCYLDRLVLSYEQCGVNVECGLDKFLADELEYEIIHIHWPEHFRWISRAATPEECFETYIRRLRQFKQYAKCVWTVHNLYPHRHPSDLRYRKLYQETIDLADGIIFHCEDAVNLIRKNYRMGSDKATIVVPHGNYSHMRSDMTMSEARCILGLPLDSEIFLFVGQVSAYKGVNRVLRAFRQMHIGLEDRKKCLFVVCGWTGEREYRGEFQGIVSNWQWIIREGWRLLLGYASGCRVFLGKKTEPVLATFLTAANTVVLGHREILTSGVPVLAATFGKKVVGPRIGCIPAYISPQGGVLYKPGSVTDLAEAMRASLELDPIAAESSQRSLAEKWDWQVNTQIIVDWLEKFGPPVRSGSTRSITEPEQPEGSS